MMIQKNELNMLGKCIMYTCNDSRSKDEYFFIIYSHLSLDVYVVMYDVIT